MKTWNSGRQLFIEGKFKASAAQFNKINKIMPTVDGYVNWATALEKSGDFNAAADAFRQTIKQFPEEPKVKIRSYDCQLGCTSLHIYSKSNLLQRIFLLPFFPTL